MDNMEQMTPRERAAITRKANAAARRAAQDARERKRKDERALVAQAMRGILADPDATSAQLTFAVLTLDDVGDFCLVPYEAKQIIDGKIDKESFSDAVKVLTREYQGGIENETD